MGIIRRAVWKLQDRRAQILLPSVLLAPIFVLVIYLLFETAKVSMTKVRQQFALDNAAYSQVSAASTYLNAVAMVNGPLPYRVMLYYKDQKVNPTQTAQASGRQPISIFELFYHGGGIPVIGPDYDTGINKAPKAESVDWGLQYDPEMGPVIRKYQASCCLMHNRKEADYQDFFPDFLEDLRKCIRSAKAAGISDDRIMLDPGVGFGKTYDMNLAVIRNLDRMQELGYPVLLGTSRKSVIGLTLDLPADQREEGTLATTVYGILHGCSFVRVHDVRANRRAIQMTEAIRKADKF